MNTVKAVATRLWLPVLLLVLWAAAIAIKPSPFFPSLDRIARAFQENWLFDRFASDVVPSMISFFVGYGSAVVLGLFVGLVLSFVPLLEKIVDPLIQFMRALPSIALIPLILVIAGIGLESKITVIVLGSIWPVLLNTIDG